MDITPLLPKGTIVISGYGPNGYRFGETVLPAPLLARPDQVFALPADVWDGDITANLRPYAAFLQDRDIVLVGTGKAMKFLPPATRTALKEAYRANFETMDSAAAARTYNVLVTEGRDVAVILLP